MATRVFLVVEEGLGSYGAPYGGEAAFSGSVVRGEERFRGVEALSTLRPPAFVFWETVALLAPSSPAPAPGRRLILKASKLFRLLISHLKQLVNVGGVGSMVDGSHVTAQIVFDVCLDLSAWDTDEIAMGLMLSDERSHAT
ncbi:hypothetical protein Bca52824_071255 [Brassica carinata]|uniref:Uncharacterized protein n=1 Tax=Brassica carinata TaxID=52824 RepID=A0A8X7Q5N9_BRACI|nr:hypothetical protein Bca52824_071255 [Brassica carinata]